MTHWNIADSIEDLELFGGRLCLDFANTVEPRRADVAGHDHLSSYAELVRWGAYVGTVDEDTAQRLRRAADEHPEEAEDVLGEAVELREAIYRTFHGLAKAEEPDPEDLDVLGEAYAKAMARSRLVTTNAGGFELGWRDADTLEVPLWPVARSAVELLTEAEPGRIKQCSLDEGCGWLFYDDSKNSSRRWCSMQGCGSRAKMRRMYARKRGAQEHPDK